MRRLPPRPLPLMIAVFVGAAIVWTPVFSLATSPPKVETPPESSLSPNPMISGVEISLEWNRGFPGLKMGENGLVVADIDGDGFDEIVVAASDDYYYHDSNSYWYVLKWDGGDYSQHFTSIPAKYEIGRIAVGQLDGDAALEIVLVEDHHVVAYDGATFEVEMAHPVLIAAPSGMDLGDVDGDGVIEAVMCNFGRYIIMDLGDGVLQTVEDRGCSDLAVGEVDGSPGLEVVIADGNSPGLVLDPMTNQIEWEHPPGFGWYVALEDVDGDTLDEIVVRTLAGVQAWNGDSRDLLWSASGGSQGADSLAISDIDGDDLPEVFFNDIDREEVVVLSGSDGAEQWSVGNPRESSSRIAAGDPDHDDVVEILLGAGIHDNGPDRLYAIDTQSHIIEWTGLDMGGPFYALEHGDFDADGDPELIFSTSWLDDRTGRSRYYVHDAATKDLEVSGPVPDPAIRAGIWKIRAADVLGDEAMEMFIPVDSYWNGSLTCRDGRTQDTNWATPLGVDSYIISMELADLDNDGDLEIVAATDTRTTGSDPEYVYVFDAITGVVEWRSQDIVYYFQSRPSLKLLRTLNIDEDANDEILVAGRRGSLLGLDAFTGNVDLRTSPSVEVTALAVGRVDGYIGEQIVIGTDSGFIETVDQVSGFTTRLFGRFPDAIDGLAIVAIDDDEAPDFVVSSDNRVYIVDGRTTGVVWVSDHLGAEVGRYDSLVVADIDWDGKLEIWVSGGAASNLVFEITQPWTFLFADGFEWGSTDLWSLVVGGN